MHCVRNGPYVTGMQSNSEPLGVILCPLQMALSIPLKLRLARISAYLAGLIRCLLNTFDFFVTYFVP